MSEEFRSWPIGRHNLGQWGAHPWDYPEIEIMRSEWDAPKIVKPSELRNVDAEGLFWRRSRYVG